MSDIVDVKVPADQQEGTQSFVAKWLKSPGEPIRENEPLLEISTDKVTVEIASPATGVLREILKNENDEVEPGTLLGRIELGQDVAGSNSARAKDASAPAPEARSSADTSDAAQELSPAVKRMLKEHGVSAAEISGTGKGGRITTQDVEGYLARRGSEAAKPGTGGSLSGRLVPHNPMRKSIAAHMVQSLLHTAPHVTTVFEADLTAIMEHREKHKEHVARVMGARLTLTSYFVKAAAVALKAVPEVNSRWREDALEIFDICNIGVATALGNAGLVVPVLHEAQSLDLDTTAKKLEFLIDRAKKGTLTSDEVQNGTFTITNHGVSGSLIATPIINQPQSAILGIGKVERRIKVFEENGEEVWRSRPMVYVTLTIDHRALDGFTANSFLGAFVDALESWS